MMIQSKLDFQFWFIYMWNSFICFVLKYIYFIFYFCMKKNTFAHDSYITMARIHTEYMYMSKHVIQGK